MNAGEDYGPSQKKLHVNRPFFVGLTAIISIFPDCFKEWAICLNASLFFSARNAEARKSIRLVS